MDGTTISEIEVAVAELVRANRNEVRAAIQAASSGSLHDHNKWRDACTELYDKEQAYEGLIAWMREQRG